MASPTRTSAHGASGGLEHWRAARAHGMDYDTWSHKAVASGKYRWAYPDSQRNITLHPRQGPPYTLENIVCAATLGAADSYQAGVDSFCELVQHTVNGGLRLVERGIDDISCADADDNSCSMLVEISFVMAGVWAQNVVQGNCEAIFNEMGQPCMNQGSFARIYAQTDNGPVSGTVEADFFADRAATCAPPSPTYTCEAGRL